MDKRENLLWQMIITIAFIAIAYVGYSLYYDNDGYLQLLDDFESEEIGTDRQLKDKVQWEKLYKGYADFYKVEMNDKILQTIWSWLHDKSHDVEGLVYEVEDKIIGLAHYRRMPSPLRGQYLSLIHI